MIDTEKLRRIRNARNNVNLNLLVLGPKGIGKRTFLSNLSLNNDFIQNQKGNQIAPFFVNRNMADTFNHYSIKVNDNTTTSNNSRESVTFTLNATTLDIGFQINNNQTSILIRNYLEDKFKEILLNEIKVEREQQKIKKIDQRIHLCLLFIDGNHLGLNQLEIDILEKIKYLANIILVIGKADKYNPTELNDLKHSIKNDLLKYNLRCFQFGVCETLQDIFLNGNPTPLNSLQPFSIVCGKIVKQENGKARRDNTVNIQRKYDGNRTIDIENSDSSDFIYLKTIILGSHLQEFKETTTDILYEKYRTQTIRKHTCIKGNQTTDPTDIMILNDLFDNDLNYKNNGSGTSYKPKFRRVSGEGKNGVLQQESQIAYFNENEMNTLNKQISISSDGFSSPSTKVETN